MRLVPHWVFPTRREEHLRQRCLPALLSVRPHGRDRRCVRQGHLCLRGESPGNMHLRAALDGRKMRPVRSRLFSDAKRLRAVQLQRRWQFRQYLLSKRPVRLQAECGRPQVRPLRRKLLQLLLWLPTVLMQHHQHHRRISVMRRHNRHVHLPERVYWSDLQ